MRLNTISSVHFGFHNGLNLLILSTLLGTAQWWLHVACLASNGGSTGENLERTLPPSSPSPVGPCDQCADGQRVSSVVVGERNGLCPTGRYLTVLRHSSNASCHCDLVCARESGQACRSSPTDLILCDPLLKLHCNEITQQCAGDLSLSAFAIDHHSFTLNWNASNSSAAFHISLTQYNSQNNVEKYLSPVKHKIVQVDKLKFSAKIENLRSNTSYLVKVEDNLREELIFVTTKANQLPKVLITYRNTSFIAIAFDDFKSSNDDSGYQIHYRQLNNDSSSYGPWLIIKSNSTPFYRLSGLKPSTTYQLQIFAKSELDHKQELHSELVNVTTLPGCTFQGKVYEMNQRVIEDCDQVCMCSSNNTLHCTERCVEPYIGVKTAQRKALICERHPSDECCVRCSETHANVTFIDKPGICPELVAPVNQSRSCSNECSHDYHCTGIDKCCKNQCGMNSCIAPYNLTSCPFKCGENAECQLDEHSSAYHCVCMEGFIDDDPSQGCYRKPERLHHCQVDNQTYAIGQSFEHHCQLCVCSEALEIECKAKCDEPSVASLSPNCKLVDDPQNPNCCKRQVCDPVSPPRNHSRNQPVCRHLNQTYVLNEKFFVDCELKCVCTDMGEIDCTPRCFDDLGYDPNYCTLNPDPDDPECCKIANCDYNSTAFKPEANLLIEMAESYNSSSIKLRLLSISTNSNQTTTLFYQKVHANMSDSSIHSWEAKNITEEMAAEVAEQAREITLTQLEPETDYSIYVQRADEVSNTVIVRTFPLGIDHTFKGCFYGSQIIKVGEIFYEGDCEFKCICREGGLRECFDRCPVFVDLIGQENCQWLPSPEDPCCTVPVCDMDNHSCLSEDGKRYQAGESWTHGSGCLRRTCKCLLKSNNSTEVKCKGGCPQIPPAVLEPNPQCASPKLVRPADSCVCPYVVCNNNINPLDLPEKQLTKNVNSSLQCEFKGKRIAVGEELFDGCRATCLCTIGGALSCRPIHCNTAFGPHNTDCLEWDIDPQFVPIPPNCCPEPKCKNDGSCSYAGIRFDNGKPIPQELVQCGKRCICSNGQVQCENICPEVSAEPPPELPCPPSMAFRGHMPGDDCCIYWQCQDIYHDKIIGSCIYKDKRYKLGEQWDDSETGSHRRCKCKVTSGILHVTCNPGNCHPIPDRFLEPTAECRMPTVVTPKDAIMCPYVICNNTNHNTGAQLDNVDIVAINATSARVRFTIPHIYVGLLGHAELHYATDINIPRQKWNINKFARPNRLFDIPKIEYHLGNLKPDTTYFLQIEVILESLRSGPISQIYKVTLPPLPPKPPTSTNPPSTSTLPPIIMLDMHLKAHPLDSSSMQVTWRSFTPQEKKFIDGIQIRYKKANLESDEWNYSQILHRNINSFNLHNLEIGVTYVIDLIFTAVDGINTNLISTKPTLSEIPLPQRDELNFEVHLYPSDITMDERQIIIELRDLPKPVSKYINFTKICFKNVENSELLENYIKIDDSGKIAVSNLLANSRYKLWIELYLTEGQMISTNSIEIISKHGSTYEGSWTGDHLPDSKYLLSFIIISTVVFFTGTTFMIITCIFLRKHSAAAITRVCISEAAYDNPTYKTFETGDKCANEVKHSAVR